jgi:hypothetical protein
MLMAVISSRLPLDKSRFVSMGKIYLRYAIQAVKLAQIQTHNNATSVFQVSLSWQPTSAPHANPHVKLAVHQVPQHAYHATTMLSYQTINV